MRVLTVSQALGYVRELFESDLLLADVWLSGEVSGPRTQPSGHTYFTLKDDAAQLRGVVFRTTMQRQRRYVDHLLHGAQVIVHGRLAVYEARGELQVVVDFVQPEGAGLQQAQFERLRQQLEEEGLFDQARKRPLPRLPARVGVVTSPAGAVFHDIQNVLGRRWPLIELVLAPTPVQGPDAPYGIAGGIAALNERGDIDVIIVARGGGSLEELATFNDEGVARAVFGSLAPVISAVGHETDFTICDFVADVRAPTPSAAAELAAPDQQQFWQQIAGRLANVRGSLEWLLSRQFNTLDEAMARAQRAAVDVESLQTRLTLFEKRGRESIDGLLSRRHDGLRRSLAQIAALDPQATLRRGYAIVQKGSSAVSSITQVQTGDGLVVKVADGGFSARVESGAGRRKAAPRIRHTQSVSEPAVQPLLIT